MGLGLKAQKFVESFREDYLEQLYSNCPDSLKNMLFTIRPNVEEEKLSSIKSINALEASLQKQQEFRDIVLRYRTEEFCAHIRCSETDFCFDFYYIDKTDSLCVLRVLDNYGVYTKTITTKSGMKYKLDYRWGFLELKENTFPLLNCYCSSEDLNEEEYAVALIPFKGTNPFVWEKLDGDVFVPAFN